MSAGRDGLPRASRLRFKTDARQRHNVPWDIQPRGPFFDSLWYKRLTRIVGWGSMQIWPHRFTGSLPC